MSEFGLKNNHILQFDEVSKVKFTIHVAGLQTGRFTRVVAPIGQPRDGVMYHELLVFVGEPYEWH